MDLSFIILTWNSEKYITACLKSLILEAERSCLVYEIFLVDNGSKDRTAPIVAAFEVAFPDKINSIFLDKNHGTTYPRNLALRKARGKFICIMDSDVELGQDVLNQLIQGLEKNPGAGMIAPKLLYPDGNLQKSIDSFPTVLSKIKRYFFLKQIEKREAKQNRTSGIFPVQYAISAMWMIKRAVLDRIGLLDENIFYSPEDVDYCYRIWRSGYQVIYHADASAIHHTQEISRGFKLTRATISHARGLIYYFIKHRYVLTTSIKTIS